MDRTEAYNDGWHLGRQWAEADLTNHAPVGVIAQELKDWYAQYQSGRGRARSLGVIRGYRDTIDRFERGVLTWGMFEQAPLGEVADDSPS